MVSGTDFPNTTNQDSEGCTGSYRSRLAHCFDMGLKPGALRARADSAQTQSTESKMGCGMG